LLLAIAGTMLVAAADELVLLFLGLELISIPTYIMLYLGRREAMSLEAAAKYFFLSILSSAMLLYGFSFLYGAAGTTDLDAVRQRLADSQDSDRGRLSCPGSAGVRVCRAWVSHYGRAFHFYAPDVYQGTTHANAGFLSVLPKIAGVLAWYGSSPSPWKTSARTRGGSRRRSPW
jgi:NADH-quinone oxidoreductase subunit N